MYKTIIIKNENKKKDLESKIEKKANKLAKDGYSLVNISTLDQKHSVLIFQDQDTPSPLSYGLSDIISSSNQKNKDKDKGKTKGKNTNKEKNKENGKEKLKDKEKKKNKENEKNKEKSKKKLANASSPNSKIDKKEKKKKDQKGKNDYTKHNNHDPAEDLIKPVTTGISEVAIES